MNNLGQREYAKLIKAAGVKPIKFHGMRHTVATLLLQAGQPVHVVSERLGHSKVSMTMEVYAHVLQACSGKRRQRSARSCTALGSGQFRVSYFYRRESPRRIDPAAGVRLDPHDSATRH
jgi:hypothetical protein